MRYSHKLRVVPLALALDLAACGGDDTGSPTPLPPPPSVAGTYGASWTLQVLRKSDGFQKEFQCWGRLTLRESTGSSAETSSRHTLAGFIVVNEAPPCAPESFELSGTIQSGGAIAFTSDAPRPPEGPCPGGKAVSFSGQVTPTEGTSAQIDVRGVTNVTCPELGEHQFTYFVQAWR